MAPPIDRRDFLKASAALGALTLVGAGCGEDPGGIEPEGEEQLPDLPDYSWEGEQALEGIFSHGVASGDPLPEAIILWTRVSPADGGPVELWWEIAEDPEFERRWQVGTVETDASRDHTVKVDVRELKPGRTYYYRFFAQGRPSPVGRTKTAPVGEVERMRAAVVSCSNFSAGLFHVYRHVAARADLDVVIHLGDYIYEYGARGFVPPGEEEEEEPQMSGRVHEPAHEIVSLQDYRTRYGQYRQDVDLQEAHRQHPFIVIWDDHEIVNNGHADGGQNHDDDEGDWAERKAAAQQAWREWMPVREDEMDPGKIWRSFQWGDLANLAMLDTRYWGRAEEPERLEEQASTERDLLGDEQERWLFDELRRDDVMWSLLGQQVMMAHLMNPPDAQGNLRFLNLDQWDGYLDDRQRLFDLLASDEVPSSVVVLTGDIHSSWANELAPNPIEPDIYPPATGEGSLAVEFVTPGVTSSGLPGLGHVSSGIRRFNPHIKYVDVEPRGYIMLDVDRQRVQAAWFHIDGDIQQPDQPEVFARAFAVYTGRPQLLPNSEPAPAVEGAPELAP